jgi:hypothetical protein
MLSSTKYGLGGPTLQRGVSRGLLGEREIRRRLERARTEDVARVGEDCDSWSKEAMRRFEVAREGEDFKGMREGMDVVRVWRGRKGWRSLSGEIRRAGRREVGVVDKAGEMAAEK